MDAAEQLAPPIVGPMPWAQICALHPDVWVCLLDIDHEPDGSIRSARVIGHDRSIRQALAQIGTSQPDTIVVHTGGRRLRFPRIEMTDEIRDIVRPRR